MSIMSSLTPVLFHHEETDVVQIDNTPPLIKVNGPTLSGQSAEVVFEVTDATSRVIKGEYSVDGGVWRLIFPVDGIPDSGRESSK
jgi:hypothetical protein